MPESEKDKVAFKAIQSSWDNWLGSKWEYSDRPDDAMKAAVLEWLDKNRDEMIASIAKAVADKQQP